MLRTRAPRGKIAAVLPWARVEGIVRGLAAQFTSPGVSVFWGYVLSAAVLASLLFIVRRRTVRGLLAYLVPRRVWLHRSTRNDLGLFVANTLLYSFVLLGPLSAISTSLGQRTWLALHQAFGPMTTPLSGTAAMLGLAVAAFVLADLGFFLVHATLHRIPVLWEFHKVHHSAAVLQPLTVMRRHPLSVVLDSLVAGLLLGPLYGLAGWLGGGQLGPLTVFGVNAVLFVGLVAGFNLQHSHVWLSFGPLDRWLISPASHQLHHSADPAHHDRNFGNFLAVWDRLAGTLLAPAQVVAGMNPRTNERTNELGPGLEFGLGPAGEAWEREYGSVWRLYLWPVWSAGRVIANRLTRKARAR